METHCLSFRLCLIHDNQKFRAWNEFGYVILFTVWSVAAAQELYCWSLHIYTSMQSVLECIGVSAVQVVYVCVLVWCLKSSHDIDNSAIMWSVPMLLCIPVMTLRLTWVVLLHVIFYREIVSVYYIDWLHGKGNGVLRFYIHTIIQLELVTLGMTIRHRILWKPILGSL